MEIAGINNFNMSSFDKIPKAQVTVPTIEKKEPTVHKSSVPYPFYQATFENTMKSHARMQAMFQEMFKDVKPLAFEDRQLYSVHGEKIELKILKRPEETDQETSSTLDVKV